MSDAGSQSIAAVRLSDPTKCVSIRTNIRSVSQEKLLLLKGGAFQMAIMAVLRCLSFIRKSNWWFHKRCISWTTRRAFDVSTIHFIRSERETIYRSLFHTIKGTRCHWLEQHVFTTVVYFRYTRKRRKPLIFERQQNNFKNSRGLLRTQNKYNKMGRGEVNIKLSKMSVLR